MRSIYDTTHSSQLRLGLSQECLTRLNQSILIPWAWLGPPGCIDEAPPLPMVSPLCSPPPTPAPTDPAPLSPDSLSPPPTFLSPIVNLKQPDTGRTGEKLIPSLRPNSCVTFDPLTCSRRQMLMTTWERESERNGQWFGDQGVTVSGCKIRRVALGQ